MFELSSSLEIGDKPRRIRVCMPPIKPILGMSCFSGPSVVPNADLIGGGQKDRQGAPAILKGKPNAFRPSYLNLRTSTILNQQTGEKRANTAF